MSTSTLGPLSDDDAILIGGDLARLTEAADPMDRRLCRLAAHYRNRALQAEDRLRYAIDLIRAGLDGEAMHEMERLFADPGFEFAKGAEG